jgi:uncharacterized alkaline shock family protein YloU
MTYYTIQNSNKGTLNISAFVISNIAQETLEELANDSLKGSISLKLARKRKNIEVVIEHNKVVVNVFFSALRNSDVQKSVLAIQNGIYDALNELTEISTIKVNVSVVSFVDNE